VLRNAVILNFGTKQKNILFRVILRPDPEDAGMTVDDLE